MPGEELKRYRLAALYTRKALGQALGLSGRCADIYIYKWEVGERAIPVKYFRRLHELLDIPYEKLIP